MQAESRNSVVTREDLVMFINACFSCTGQREFYTSAREQAVSIDFLHQYILGNYRRLYARTLAAGINHFNQSLIIINLLSNIEDISDVQKKEEGELIFAALLAFPPQRAYATLEQLRNRRVKVRRPQAGLCAGALPGLRQGTVRGVFLPNALMLPILRSETFVDTRAAAQRPSIRGRTAPPVGVHHSPPTTGVLPV
jgi:hypothetical protein